MNLLTIDPRAGARQAMGSVASRTDVLIVDDEPDTLAEYAEALQRSSFRCLLADSGGPALDLLDSNPSIDVIVTDIRMPGVDGLSLLAAVQLRAVERPWLRPIVVSGQVTTDLAIDSIRFGIQAFLCKPLGRKELVEAVTEAALRASRHRAETARAAQLPVAELQDLRGEVARLGAMVQALDHAAPVPRSEPQATLARTPPASPSVDAPAQLVTTVRRMMRVRQARATYFPADLFADPAWDMLLDLTLARLIGKTVSVSSLCLAAGVPATTALRRLDDLCAAGLTMRRPDARDGRRKFVELTEDGACRMLQYLERLGADAAR